MPIDPATGEEAEDLSKIEWGAGLGRLLDRQIPNVILTFLGCSVVGLPAYLIAGGSPDEVYLSRGNDIIFPIVLGILVLILSATLFIRLRRLSAATGARPPAAVAKLTLFVRRARCAPCSACQPAPGGLWLQQLSRAAIAQVRAARCCDSGAGRWHSSARVDSKGAGTSRQQAMRLNRFPLVRLS